MKDNKVNLTNDNLKNENVSIPTKEKNNLYSLTTPQKNIWSMERYYNKTSLNNVCGSVIIHEDVDFDRLKAAVDVLVRMNDAFGIQFVTDNDTVKQFYNRDIVNSYSTKIVEVADEKELAILEEKLSHVVFTENNLFDLKVFKLPSNEGGVICAIHHSLSDSWSIGLISKYITEVYYDLLQLQTMPTNLNDFAEKERAKFKIASYFDFVEKENKYLSSSSFKKDKKFWNDVFETVPELPQFAPIKNETFEDSPKASRQAFELSSAIMSKVKKYCTDNNISVFNFLMSIYSLYISAVSNSKDFVIGTPVLNRSNIAEKSTLGMYVSTMPLHIKVYYDLSFSAFCKEISSNTFSSFRHQHYPYESILSDLRNKYNNIPNLYNLIVSYQITKTVSDKVDCETHWNFNGYSPDDMQIHIVDYNDTGALSFLYDYKNCKFSHGDIKDLHCRILSMIDIVLNNSEICIRDIDVVTPNEKDEILNVFNDTSYDYDKNKTLSILFEEQAKKTPNDIALIFEDKELTYNELNEKANSLACYLRNAGITKNDIVGIMCSRSLEMIISILAVLKSGAAYTPIDPTYPKKRVNYMLDTIDSKVLLTQKNLESKIDFDNKVYVDLDNDNIYKLPNKNLKNISEPDDLSYVIFTSGSTGKPKGVMLTQKALSNLANYCNSYIEYLKKPSNIAVVSTTTVSFDIFIFETLISLQRGLKLIIANEDEQNTPSLLNELINKHDVKIIQATPSRMQIFIQNVDIFPALKNLKYVTLAGEQLPQSIVNTLNSFGAVVYNGYGPSETTVFSTLTKMTGKSVTIGKPLYNTQIYILDDNLNPLPIGVSGEIYIAGDGVGKGYLKNEELTKKNFIENPFIPNTIMYRTGDLGTYKSDGTIICLGRADHQIKIRGQRIELGEVEEQIVSLPFVKACVVVKREDENHHEFLCAYYTTNISTDKDNTLTIREHLEIHLPKYMIPQYFIKMQELPYTPNGKVDRKALPEPKYINSNDDIIAPRNEIESSLLQLFVKVLHIDTISISDSFFDLGGDSLSAINLSSQIQNEFGADIYVKDILENPTIQNISDLISRRAGMTNMPVIKPIESAEFYMVSSAQRRIYFASQVDRNSIAYNISGGIIFDGKVDFDKLNNAFKVIVKRHEPLRTSFELHDGDVVQKIKEDIDFNLEVTNNVDFKELNTIFSEFVKPFDLASAPLFSAKLINFSDDKSALLINSHHIIFDGTSISIFVDELCKLYNGSTLDELSITYKDFAFYENGKIKSGSLENAEKYWIDKFKGELPVLNMPTLYPRPAIQSFEGRKVYSKIDTDLVAKISDVSKELQITPYMLMLGVFYILLSKYTSQNDIVIGSPVACRDIPCTDNILGMFVNTLALRENIEYTLPFKSFLLSIKDDLLNAYKYQTYPFDELVSKLDIPKDLSRNPLYDVMFVYQSEGFVTPLFGDIKSKLYMPDNHTSKCDLSLEAIPKDGIIELSYEYNTKLFNKEFITNMSKHYLHILNTVLNDYNTRISTICLLSVDEQNKFYGNINNTSLKYSKDTHIIDLFEEQVRKTPNDIALVFEDETYTYEELNDKVNRLASYVRKHPSFQKITNNEVKAIGIMMNRRAEILISILANLKNGCASIPIDPAYPEDRISYMIETSNISLILTEQEQSERFSTSNGSEKLNIDTIFIDDKKSYIDYEDFKTPHGSDDLAYLIFTSGSTGKPKGVMIKDSNLVNYIYAVRKILPLKNKTIVSVTTMCFDLFMVETLLPVCSGVKIVFANNNEQNSPILLNKLCQKHNVNILQTTPSKLAFLTSDDNNIDYMKNMKLLMCSGEPYPQTLLTRLKKITPSRIFSMYGPTETTIWCSFKELTNEKHITVGVPLANCTMYVLDNDLNMLPPYVPGKIYIGGDCVTKGYLNRPELTSERYIEYNGQIVYDSGDLGQLNYDNEFECIGRTDFQVKIRGLRVELGEVEKQISNYQGVSESVVIVKNINNRDVLCGYFVASGRVTISLLRDKLSKKLPNYMIPTYLIQLDSFPRTPNGKLDRKKLPEPKVNTREIVNPKNAMQRKILLIWKNVLSIDEISIDDNFFEIGGDSLCALKLQLELMKININVNYGDIFKYNTISSLCEFIESIEKNEPPKPIYHKYNFIKANMALWRNNDNFKLNLTQKEIKNVLLVGATGFLGIHVLAELLKIDNIKIYCLIRNDPSTSAENKLKNKFKYYFGSDLSSLFGSRIIVIPGEITNEYFGVSENTYKMLASNVYTVVNCAALVKHFGKYEDFEKANVIGVKNIVTFCEKYGKTLFHASTISVSGNTLMGSASTFNPSKKVYFAENNLFINQSLDNVYVRSKFEAEKFLLQELANKKLKGIILRVGNVTNRFIDGKFQENASENAFHNRLKAFMYMKMIPKSIYDGYAEFTPVDILAESIINTMKFYTPPMSVLHLYNSNHLYINDFIDIVKNYDINIDVVDDDIFKENLKNILFNSPNYNNVSTLLNDIDNNFNLIYKTNLKITNNFTLKFFEKTGFKWPNVTKEYIKKILDNL